MNAKPEPPRGDFFTRLRNVGIYRTEDRWIAGVCGAIHRRTGFDPALIRGVFIIAIFLGIGFIAYGIAWALLPDENTGEIVAEEISRGQLSGQFFGALIFIITGIWAPLNVGGWVVGNSWLAVPSWIGIAVIAVIAAVTLSRNSKSPGETPHAGPAGAPPHFSGSPEQPGSATDYSPPETSEQPAAETSAFPPDPTERLHQQGDAAHTQPFSAPPAGAAPGWQSAPEPAPYPAHPAPPAQKPPKVRHPRRQRPSTAITAAVIGLAFIAAAITVLLVSADSNPWISAAGVTVVVLGLGIVISGLVGRTSAVFSPLAIALLLGTVIASFGWVSYGQVGGTLAWSPSEQSPNISRGQALGVGTLTADLRDVPRNLADPNIPLRFGVGQVEVTVPNDRPVYVDTTVSVGEVNVESPQGNSSEDVIFGPGTYVFGDDGSDEPPLHVSVLGLVGEVTIKTAPPTNPSAPDANTSSSDSHSTTFEVQP